MQMKTLKNELMNWLANFNHMILILLMHGNLFVTYLEEVRIIKRKLDIICWIYLDFEYIYNELDVILEARGESFYQSRMITLVKELQEKSKSLSSIEFLKRDFLF